MNEGQSIELQSATAPKVVAPRRNATSGLMGTIRVLSMAAIGLTAAQGCNDDKLLPSDACLKGSELCPVGTGATGGTNEGGTTGTGGNGTGGTGLNEGGTAGAGGNGTGGTGLNEGGAAGAGGNGTGGTGLNEGGTAGAGGNGTGGTGLNEGGTAGTGGSGTGGSGGVNTGGNGGEGGINTGGTGGSGGEGGGEVGDPCVNHYSCEGDLLCCGNVCIQQSEANCGNCGVTCSSPTPFCTPSVMMCTAGCASQYLQCGNVCRDTYNDNLNCGGCDNVCDQNETCTNGFCVP